MKRKMKGRRVTWESMSYKKNGMGGLSFGFQMLLPMISYHPKKMELELCLNVEWPSLFLVSRFHTFKLLY